MGCSTGWGCRRGRPWWRRRRCGAAAFVPALGIVVAAALGIVVAAAAAPTARPLSSLHAASNSVTAESATMPHRTGRRHWSERVIGRMGIPPGSVRAVPARVGDCDVVPHLRQAPAPCDPLQRRSSCRSAPRRRARNGVHLGAALRPKPVAGGRSARWLGSRGSAPSASSNSPSVDNPSALSQAPPSPARRPKAGRPAKQAA